MRVEEAEAKWREEIGETLYELRRTLSPDGRGVMVIADSVIDRRPLRADEQIKRVAQRAGIDITCIASQERPLFLHGAEHAFSDRPRMEHVVVFRPGERPHRKNWQNRAIEKELEALKGRERPARFLRAKDGEANRSTDAPRSDFNEARRHGGADPRRGFEPRGDEQRGPARRPGIQRNSQDKTWGSSPKGPGRPRVKPGPKPR